jgi:hypothetical protein
MAPPVDPEENKRIMIPPDQIAAAARAAGWTGNDVIIATAVAMAESAGGDRTAVGRAVPSRPDYGLWQVNYIHNAEFPGFFPPGVAWKGIVTNAVAAKKVWDSQGWSVGWTTFRNGAYSKFLAQAQIAAGQNTTLPTIPDPGDIGKPDLNPIDALPNLSNLFGDFSPYLWIAGGSVLVLLGVLILAKDTDIGKAALSAAKVAAL